MSWKNKEYVMANGGSIDIRDGKGKWEDRLSPPKKVIETTAAISPQASKGTAIRIQTDAPLAPVARRITTMDGEFVARPKVKRTRTQEIRHQVQLAREIQVGDLVVVDKARSLTYYSAEREPEYGYREWLGQGKIGDLLLVVNTQLDTNEGRPNEDFWVCMVNDQIVYCNKVGVANFTSIRRMK